MWRAQSSYCPQPCLGMRPPHSRAPLRDDDAAVRAVGHSLCPLLCEMSLARPLCPPRPPPPSFLLSWARGGRWRLGPHARCATARDGAGPGCESTGRGGERDRIHSSRFFRQATKATLDRSVKQKLSGFGKTARSSTGFFRAPVTGG